MIMKKIYTMDVPHLGSQFNDFNKKYIIMVLNELKRHHITLFTKIFSKLNLNTCPKYYSLKPPRLSRFLLIKEAATDDV